MRLFPILSLCLLNLACAAQSAVQKVNADDFQKQIGTPGIQLLDVRTTGEFQQGHISHAMLADWNDATQFKDRVQFIDKDKPVYVYCLVGARSAAAAAWMRQNGYTNVVELDGGINAWKKTGKPLQGLPATPVLHYQDYLSGIPDNETVLVNIGAAWCPPCKKMQSITDSLQQDHALHFRMIQVDAGVQTEILKELNVTTIPVFMVYKKGAIVWRHEGVATMQEIKNALQ